MNAKKMFGWTVRISALALLTGLPAFACGGDCSCQTVAQAVAQLGLISAQGAGGQATVVDVEFLGEQEFVREALESSAARTQLGQLAQQKSQSDDIQQFSKQMVRDYGDLSEQVIDRVAKMLAIYDSKSPSKKDKELAKSLQGLSGPQFDELYIKVMTKAYRQDLKKFNNEAALAQVPGVKVTAELGASIVSQHLKLLEEIAERHDANRVEPVHNVGIATGM
jgi:putative membrane protein